MAKSSLDLADWNDFKRDLEKLARKDQQRIARKAGEQVGVTFDDAVKKKLPPPVRKLKVAQYWTDKQRGWWWATMRAKADGRSNALPGWKARWRTVRGKKTLVISGGYKRTGLLVRSLTFDIVQARDATTVSYGTNVQHAKWVIDLNNQSKYHQGQWLALQTEARRQLPLLRDVFADVMIGEIRKIL
jgi:hypothetical protein